jgi:hypothetical protein
VPGGVLVAGVLAEPERCSYFSLRTARIVVASRA